MVKRLSGVDQNSQTLTNVPTPSNGGDAVNKDYVDAAAGVGPVGTVSIEHKRYSNYNADVITVRGDRRSIVKLAPNGLMPDGTIDAGDLLTPKQMAKQSGFYTLTNCDAAAGASDNRNNGINIIEGVAYQDFGSGVGGLQGADLEALLLMKDGTMRAAYKSENKTAQDYVNEGAWSSFGYGPILVKNGIKQNWHLDSRFSGFTAFNSARLIFGMVEPGIYKMLLIEGRSNEYGIAGEAITDAAIAEGLNWAVNLDGGGTVQAIYNGAMAHPSSDAAGERKAASFVGFNAAPQGEYDTGWISLAPTPGVSSYVPSLPALAVRQVGNRGLLALNSSFNPAIAINTWKVVSDMPIPERFMADNEVLMRSIATTSSSRAVGVSIASNRTVNVRTQPGDSTALSLVVGYTSWVIKNS